jgi:hypothetical protein
VSDDRHNRVEAETRGVVTMADQRERSLEFSDFRRALLVGMWVVAAALFLFGDPGAAAGMGPVDRPQGTAARLCQERLSTTFETRYSSAAGTDVVSAIEVRGLEASPGSSCASRNYDLALKDATGADLAHFRGRIPRTGDELTIGTDGYSVNASDVSTVTIQIRG